MIRGRRASQDGYAARRSMEDGEMRPATQPVLHAASSTSSSSQPPPPRPPASQPLLHGDGRDEADPQPPTPTIVEGEDQRHIESAAFGSAKGASQQQQPPGEQTSSRMDVDEPAPAAEEQGDQRSVEPEPEPEPPLQAQSFHIDLTNSQATSILEATPPPAPSPSNSAAAAAQDDAGPSQRAAPPQGSPRLPPLEPSSSPPPPPRVPTPTPPQIEAPAAGPSSSSSIPAALLQPSPPRRNLRTRKPGQLHPYTVEMALYKRRLERNDWEDAVVTDHHMRRRMREERERQAANELPIDGDGDEEDEGSRREREEEKRRRREEREEKRRRRDERRRREAEEAAREAVQEESQAIRSSGSARRTDKGKGKANEASARRPNISTQELFARFGGMVSEDEDDDADSQAGGAGSTPSLAARGRPGSAGRQYGSRRRGGAQALNGQEDEDDSDHSSSSTSPVPPSRKRRAIRSTSSSSPSSSSSPTRPHRRPQPAPPPLSSSSSSSSSSASASSADEEDPQLDLDRYFKQLKRMMPVSMARKYIADLRSMRKGKAYHSDGHESDTPEPSSASGSDDGGGDDGADMTMTPATSPADAAALRPGEARKRQGQGRGTPTGDARFELLGDSDSESEDQQSIISVSSSSDDDARAGPSQAYDGDIRWWAQPEERGVRAPRREEDAIDRMLSRAVGAPRRPAGAASKRRRATRTGTKRARAAGGSSSAKHRRPAQQSSSTALRDRELNRPASSKSATTPQQKQSAKRKRHTGTTSRTSRPYAAYRSTDGPQPRAPNPPVVQPRARRMLDLRQDDVLFDVELLAQPPPPLPRPQGQDSDDDDDSAAAAREAREYAERVRSYREQSQVGRPLIRRRITVVPGPASAGVHTTPAAQPRQAIARTDSRESATSSKSPSVATSPPPLRKGQGLRPFLRVSSRDGGAPHSKPNGPPQMSRAQLDANSWADLTNLRLDFGIRPLPAGRVSFDPSTAIGRGRLFELVELGKLDATPGVVRGHTRLAGHTVLGVDLPAQPDVEVFVELMPQVFDAIYVAAETIRAGGSHSGEGESQDDGAGDLQAAVTRAAHGVEDLLRYLAQGITSLAEIVRPREVRQYVSSIKAHLVHLFERFQSASFTAERQGQGQKDFETLLLKLRWFDVETSWRHIASKGVDTGVGEEGMDFEEKLADEEEMVLAAEGLMISLLSHGLHRTMHTIKLASRSTDPSSSSPTTPITDTSAELWISLIHLLNTTSTHLGPHTSFWPLLTSSLTQWLKILPPRRPVLMSEAIWFVTLSLCCLSQFSASNGTATSRPALAQHWPLVVQAFSVVKLRYDESIECAMPSSALARRDQYLRAITQRCFNLVSLWRWGGEGAEGALSKIFDVFNAQHKLADLPTEEDHDFPPFLRELDEGRLWEEGSREGTTYHVFLKLLAHVARSLKETDTTTGAQGQDAYAAAAASSLADRKISRLFSRICPVRVMTFTRLHPPTSRERSSLFNHYSVAMLHLFLVPSAAPQRLRQIKSFLNFKEADAQSQVTCIRAMMYAAVVHRHFGLEVGSIVEWFGSIIRVLVGEAEEVNRKVARQSGGGGGGGAAAGGPGEYFETQRQAKRVTSLLVAALRSIQHVVEHASLAGGDAAATTEATRLRYPDPQLINRAWTADVLQTQSAIDPAVGMEVLKCIQSFLVQRNLVVAKLRPRSQPPQHGSSEVVPANGASSTSRNAQQAQSESQDSFAELFDDDGGFDFADPALDNLLDGGDGSAAAPAPASAATSNGISPALADSIRSADLVFAHTLRSHLSPSLFSLISNIFHPDRAREGRLTSLGISSSSSDIPPPSANGQRQHLESLLKRGARRRYLEILVDCWAGCAHVLVENGLRDWAGYVTFGNECWRRLEDPVGKRDVALRFLRDAVVLDPEVVRGHDRCRREMERGGQQAQHQGKQDHYGEFLQVWFASAPARCLSVQAEYTHALFYPEEEGSQVQVGMPWFPRSSLPANSARLDLPLFEAHRSKLILGAVRGMRRDYEGHGTGGDEDQEDDDDETERAFRRTQVFPCLSALLSSMRVHLEALRVTSRLHAALLNGARRQGGRSDTDDDTEGRERQSDEERYLGFCQQVLRGIEGEAGEKILRGVKGELERTWVVVRRKEGEMKGTTA